MLDRLTTSPHWQTFLGTLAVLAALLVVVWLVVGAAVTFAWIAEVVA